MGLINGTPRCSTSALERDMFIPAASVPSCWSGLRAANLPALVPEFRPTPSHCPATVIELNGTSRVPALPVEAW